MTQLDRLVDELARQWLFWIEWADDLAAHQAMWGVPCGPTLSMVNPPNLRGLLADFIPTTQP